MMDLALASQSKVVTEQLWGDCTRGLIKCSFKNLAGELAMNLDPLRSLLGRLISTT